MKLLTLFVMLYLAAVSSMSFGAIVYTNISDYYLGSGDSYSLNMDGSGGIDVSFYGDGFSDVVPRLNTYFGTGVVRSGTQDVLCINSGQSIGSSSSWADNSLTFINNFGTSSQFPSGSNRYIGVRFTAPGGGIRYGWVLVEYTSNALIIKSYAYESSGGSIAAGSQGSSASLSESEADLSFSIFPNPAVDELTLLNANNQMFNATIVDVNGKEMFISLNVIDCLRVSTSNWPSGVYFVQIELLDGAQFTHRVTKF